MGKKLQEIEQALEQKVVAPVEKALESAKEALREELVEFDAWYAQREALIPIQHYKEILKADFEARKMGVLATMAQWDEALKKYGVKLG